MAFCNVIGEALVVEESRNQTFETEIVQIIILWNYSKFITLL
jgi:hypothetical protein